MRIGIIGGAANAGRALCAEAVRRGHQVTAIVREPDTATALLGPEVAVLAKDAFDLTDDDLRGFDVISTAPARA
jgi:putative NADH-flavin reductase